jgi:hypothetical protein
MLGYNLAWPEILMPPVDGTKNCQHLCSVGVQERHRRRLKLWCPMMFEFLVG